MSILTIPRSSISKAERDLYVTEASDLRIRPGQTFPDVIEVMDGEYDPYPLTLYRVNVRRVYDGTAGADNRLGQHFDPEGEFMAQDYMDRSRVTFLRIFND